MSKMSSLVPLLSSLTLALMVAGCAIHPQQLSEEEQQRSIEADQARLFKAQIPISGPLDLAEVMARAISYNLDHRLQQIQSVLEDKQLNLAQFDMLPRAMAQAGYISRNKESSSTSALTSTGVQSNQASTSLEKDRDTRSLAFSWNILDFGVSYYQAKQSANRVLMMEERRRRVLQNLMQEVRSSYWQTLAAQESEPEIRALLERVNQALTDAQRIERERLLPPMQSLAYRKSLIEQAQQLESLLSDMGRARVRLAALINVAPGTEFSLVPMKEAVPVVVGKPKDLEAKALAQRPELREARYESRNTELEARKALARLLPGIELSTGYYYDSNKYLTHNDWLESSVQVSWNLFNLLRYSDQKDYLKTQAEVIEARRLALTMAVIAQVNLSWHDYQDSLRQNERMQTLAGLEQSLREQVAATTQEATGTQLEDIRAESSLVLARLRARQAQVRTFETQALLLNSIGGDPLASVKLQSDMPSMTTALRAINEAKP